MKRAVSAVLLGLLASHSALAADVCYDVKAELSPTDSLQIVVWVETADGQYIDTLYMTAKTGFYGLGNRPGRMDFNSGPIPNPAAGVDDMWPYGRRLGVFPVWAHRHNLTWPEVVFQDGAENNLSHSQGICSQEVTGAYCRPVSSDNDPQCWPGNRDKTIWDTGTCATTVYTDKGKLDITRMSLYPPRADLMRTGVDSSDVEMYSTLNTFDAITHATPKAGDEVSIPWSIPPNPTTGNYVMWVEVSKAFDFNDFYSAAKYPGPQVSYKECGLPYRGQPSVVYSVPFSLAPDVSVSTAVDYAGFGDVNGETGTLHAPDETITSDTPGSGALRLQLVSADGQLFRLRVTSVPVLDYAQPGAPTRLRVRDVRPTAAELDFVESGDDGDVGVASRYDIRVMANQDITEDNFDSAFPVLATVTPVGPGEPAEVSVSGLLPETEYSIGVRAYDDCRNPSPLVVTRLTTADREVGTVDACFIATAAYGSAMAGDVAALRSFRDSALASSALGELAIETYYTFGPAMAGVIGESDVLRATARAAIAPLVQRIRRR